ncbi:MAG: hypothetical protein Aureis2KO_11320 [Aureisphaera sp.]
MYSRAILGVLVSGSLLILGFQNPEEDQQPLTKIALREVGHQLLLSNEDSTSLVSPVLEKGNNNYRVSFQKALSIAPENLVAVMNNSLQKANLPEEYIVEVVQCSDDEVAYSYAFSSDEEKYFIPCGTRNLPEDCYALDVKFAQQSASFLGNPLLLILFIISLLAFTIEFMFHKRKQNEIVLNGPIDYTPIGSFRLYPEQNILVKEAEEIQLSIKECQLLTIFASKPNQVIKREELTKRVWEDNGVVVGRSLDTYISKLRKKLKEDTRLKITNVHGVGYKLEELEH